MHQGRKRITGRWLMGKSLELSEGRAAGRRKKEGGGPTRVERYRWTMSPYGVSRFVLVYPLT